MSKILMCLIACGIGVMIGLHYQNNTQDQNKDVYKWTQSGCDTDSDCEAMEKTMCAEAIKEAQEEILSMF